MNLDSVCAKTKLLVEVAEKDEPLPATSTVYNSMPVTPVTLQSPSENRFLLLNLCGKVYQLDLEKLTEDENRSLLKRFALCSHKERLQIADSYCYFTKAYYFWRSPLFFEYVLQYHITGALHCPAVLCQQAFLDELKFWEIEVGTMSNCCKDNLPAPVAEEEDTSVLRNGSVVEAGHHRMPESDEFTAVCCGQRRRLLWNILEHPGSSFVAKVFAFWSVGLIVVSVVALILGSMVQFQDGDGEPVKSLVYLEYACVVWFTLEYCIRLIVTPLRCNFVKDVVNIIDALAIFPFYLEFCLLASGHTVGDLRNVKGALLAMRVLRVLRVTRVFKLARYSPGLQSFIRTVYSSHEEIKMLMMFLSSCVLLFSTTIYFMEKDAEHTPFTSIPATFWWAIVTMTTVGYGDMIPVTFGGKLVASFATVAGVIVLAFPITMIVENFCKHYQAGARTEADGKPVRLHVKSAAII